MKPKPITPYERLHREVISFCRRLQNRHTRKMISFSKEDLRMGWSLAEVYERVAAAAQLGYSVKLVADEKGLTAMYEHDVPVPCEWQS